MVVISLLHNLDLSCRVHDGDDSWDSISESCTDTSLIGAYCAKIDGWCDCSEEDPWLVTGDIFMGDFENVMTADVTKIDCTCDEICIVIEKVWLCCDVGMVGGRCGRICCECGDVGIELVSIDYGIGWNWLCDIGTSSSLSSIVNSFIWAFSAVTVLKSQLSVVSRKFAAIECLFLLIPWPVLCKYLIIIWFRQCVILSNKSLQDTEAIFCTIWSVGFCGHMNQAFFSPYCVIILYHPFLIQFLLSLIFSAIVLTSFHSLSNCAWDWCWAHDLSVFT